MFNVNTKSPEKEKKAEKEEVKKFKLNAIDNEYANAKCQDKENEKEKEKVKDNNNTKKKRAKKRKATMPVGGPSKKVTEAKNRKKMKLARAMSKVKSKALVIASQDIKEGSKMR